MVVLISLLPGLLEGESLGQIHVTVLISDELDLRWVRWGIFFFSFICWYVQEWEVDPAKNVGIQLFSKT